MIRLDREVQIILGLIALFIVLVFAVTFVAEFNAIGTCGVGPAAPDCARATR